MDTPSEGGSISGRVVKVTRELLFSRDGIVFLCMSVCLVFSAGEKYSAN